MTYRDPRQPANTLLVQFKVHSAVFNEIDLGDRDRYIPAAPEVTLA